MAAALYPLCFEPIYKDYLWGGSRIHDAYGRGPTTHPCAESWEIADRPEGMSVVRNGPLSGTSLNELVQHYGTDLLGTLAPADTRAFPLLIKVIDAKQRLSVQVHPNDTNAAHTGGEPKTEMWYVLGVAPDAAVFAGLTPGTTSTSFKAALKENHVADLLNRIPLLPGQAIFIPGGRIHAIAEGCLLLEIQQNSNTTYRVYDWDRVGADGKPRELHTDLALKVIDWNDPPPTPITPDRVATNGSNRHYSVCTSAYFDLSRLELETTETLLPNPETLRALFVANGSVRLVGCGHDLELPEGTSCLLPAAVDGCELSPSTEDAAVLVTQLPGSST